MWVVFVCALKKLCESLMRKIWRGPREPPFLALFSVMVNIYDSLVFTCKVESNSEVLYVNIENDQVGNMKCVNPPLWACICFLSAQQHLQCSDGSVHRYVFPVGSRVGTGFRLNTAKTSKQHTALKTLKMTVDQEDKRAVSGNIWA